LKFRDSALSQPPEYRAHVVTSDDTHGFEARHIASGNVRQFEKTREACSRLEAIGRRPVATVDLDCLTGERVRIHLKMGSTITGTVTAVRYGEIDILGQTIRFVQEIELDKSGGSAYPLHEIFRVQLVPR
jgi:hypothetical protein